MVEQAVDATSVSAFVALANRCVAAGAIGAAYEALRRAASLSPDDGATWSLLGLIAGHQRDAPLSYLSYRRRLSLGAAAAQERLRLSLAAVWVGQPKIASRELENALRMAPSLVEAGEEIANAALTSGMIELAEALFEILTAWRSDWPSFARGLHIARALGAGSPAMTMATMRRWGTSSQDRHHPGDAAALAEGSPRYLVIRGYGVGFWGEVTHVANHLALARILGRTPIVHWGPEFRYRDHAGETNAWTLYFEATAVADVFDLARSSRPIFPGSWLPSTLAGSSHRPMRTAVAPGNSQGISGLAALNRPEAIVVADGYVEMSDVLSWAAPSHPLRGADAISVFREIFTEQIRLQPALAEMARTSASELFTGQSVIAIHFRAQHAYKERESIEGRSLTFDEYFSVVDAWLSLEPAGRLFLISDLDGAVEAFRHRYGARLIAQDRLRLTHAGGFDIGLDLAADGTRLAREVLLDAYLAASCDYFVGDGASGVSCAVTFLKAWPADRLVLLRENVILNRRGLMF